MSWQLFEATDFNGSSDRHCGLCSWNCERQGCLRRTFLKIVCFFQTCISLQLFRILFLPATGIVAGKSSLLVVFLVGAFSLKEKSPTNTVSSFFQLTISLWVVHILQLVHLFNFHQLSEPGKRGFDFRTEPQIFYASKSRGETKGAALCVFFGTMRLFFGKFSNSIKGSPCIFLNFLVCRNVYWA